MTRIARGREQQIVKQPAAVASRQHDDVVGLERLHDAVDRIDANGRPGLRLCRGVNRSGRQDQRQQDVAPAATRQGTFPAGDHHHAADHRPTGGAQTDQPPRARRDEGDQDPEGEHPEAADRHWHRPPCGTVAHDSVRQPEQHDDRDLTPQPPLRLPPFEFLDHIAGKRLVATEGFQKRDGDPWCSHVSLPSSLGTPVQSATSARCVLFTARRPWDVTRK